MKDKIVIKGARAHNLKNVDLTIPRDQLVVFTGVAAAKALLLSIRYMQRDKDAMWSRSPPMQGSFWGRWKSRM